MRKKRAGAGSTILLAAFLCGCLAGTSPLRAAETAPADPAAQIVRNNFLILYARDEPVAIWLTSPANVMRVAEHITASDPDPGDDPVGCIATIDLAQR
jgi:hypothetical protein